MNKTNNDQQKGLKDYGIIYLSGDINSESARSICEQIIEINVAGEIDHIQMIINSHGGSCTDGFAIIDIMEWSKIPIFTAGIGLIASMGLLVFMAGKRRRRVITPRTSILSHRFAGISRGNHSQLLACRKEEDLMHERIVAHYLEYSNIKDQKHLERDLLKDVDTWLSPTEALEYSIADIIEPGVIRKESTKH